jgi:hypothetical protein
MYTQSSAKNIVERDKENSCINTIKDRKLGGIGKPLSDMTKNNIMYRISKEANPYA